MVETEAVVRFIKKDGKREKAVVMVAEQKSPKARRTHQLTDQGVEFVRQQAAMGCTQKEIADNLMVCIDTLTNPLNREKFLRGFNQGKAEFLEDIRHCQRKIMRQGSAPMAIHLGINYLGQVKEAETSELTTSPINEFVKALAKYKDEDDDRWSS